jgi:hypothetical protein
MPVCIIFDYVCSVFYQKTFQTNLSVPGLDTRNKNQLYFLVANLLCFQRCFSNSSVNIFNYLPNHIKNLTNYRVQFKLCHINILFLIICCLYLALSFVMIKFQQRCIWLVLHVMTYFTLILFHYRILEPHMYTI